MEHYHVENVARFDTNSEIILTSFKPNLENKKILKQVLRSNNDHTTFVVLSKLDWGLMVRVVVELLQFQFLRLRLEQTS